MNPASPIKIVLHVGCGPNLAHKLHPMFRTHEWRQIRVDLDPAVEPDLIASMTDMSVVESDSVEAVWSSHNLEHLYAHEVPVALEEFHRVLKPGGFVLITLPDLQQVAVHVAAGNLEGLLYTSPAGPIAALDVLFGHRSSISRCNAYMAHKTGFVAETLTQKLQAAGFQHIQVESDTSFNLWAMAYKEVVRSQ